jgi:phage shock protein A
MLSVQDKAAAMDSMIEQGLIRDPLDNRSREERELSALRDGHAVDDQLAQLKAQMAQDAVPGAAQQQLPPPK